MKEVLKHTPKDVDIEELRLLYDSAFSDTEKRYARFNKISDTSSLDNVTDVEILSVAIINSAETELAKILHEISPTK